MKPEDNISEINNNGQPITQSPVSDADTPSLEEVLSRFDGRHNFKPQKPAWLSISGLIVGILGWIAIFFLPKRIEHSFEPLFQQLFIMMGVAVFAFILSLLGRKRAPGISFFGYLVSGGLFIFFLIAYIVLKSITE